MLSKAEEEQMNRERISDALIDLDEYFQMDDPTSFLDWAVAHVGDWTDIDAEGDIVVDYLAMFDHWSAAEMAFPLVAKFQLYTS